MKDFRRRKDNTLKQEDIVEVDEQKKEISKEQIAENLGRWLVGFGNHILENPSLLIDGQITCEQIKDDLSYSFISHSSLSYKNACKISFTLTKKAG